MLRRASVVLAVSFLFLAGVSVASATSYNLTSLGTVSGATSFTPSAIATVGGSLEIVGTSQNASLALSGWYWTASTGLQSMNTVLSGFSDNLSWLGRYRHVDLLRLLLHGRQRERTDCRHVHLRAGHQHYHQPVYLHHRGFGSERRHAPQWLCHVHRQRQR